MVFGLIVIFSSPVPASAGVLSFLGGILSSFGNKEVIEEVNNLQNMALLQAVLNVNPVPSRGGGDITIINGSALLPDTGLFGNIADIEDLSSSEQISLYVVREGDSLSQIAKMFSVSVNTIIWANDINRGDLIRTGQTLLILPITGIEHTVKSGETVAGIAKKYKGDVDEIVKFNGLFEDGVLSVGETIIIPDGEGVKPVYSYSRTLVIGAGGPAYSGYYISPVSNGGRKSQGLHGYNAVDLAASCGTPIVASASGDVLISDAYGWNAGYGKYIVIKHPNGTQTLYSHNVSNIVSSGGYVVKGQVIGYVGSTGRSTGCHVHFEIRGAQNPF